ncbi:MAG TPA: NAD(P)/FAD-dependent oxidoreductase [Candidatus Xenobia bacterium]|nr:NAD(P)/FAD-dependent oxidoreductase [Candidatus Xenobia bacterium]
MADVLIAGGGPAGSALAILLGRQGLSVELFDRSRFPREKPCGEGLMPAGLAVLNRLGAADAIGGAPFFGIRFHFGDKTIEGRFPQVAGFPIVGRGQRRQRLDRILFQLAAETPGVAARAGAKVEAPLLGNGRVVGLCVNGEPRQASLVVAADGARSRLRRQLGLDLPVRRKRFGVRAHFRLAPGREQPPWVEVFAAGDHELYVTPLPEGEMLVAALADSRPLRESIERVFRRWCGEHPAVAARLEGAEQVSSLLCASPLEARARSGVAPGIVLLGDAAGFLDPITGGGMTQALMTAELLAGYVAKNHATAGDWLWEFERDRRALLWDYRFLTHAMLFLADHPRLTHALLTRLRLPPVLLSHLIGVSSGVRRLLGVGALKPSEPFLPAEFVTGCAARSLSANLKD